MVGDTRQGWVILAAMPILLALFCSPRGLWAEQSGNPLLTGIGVDQQPQGGQAGGNMEGKEMRFGVTQFGPLCRRDDGHFQRRSEFHA